MYGKPALLEALKEWEAIARDAGTSRASLAYRWVLYHSALMGELGDGCIIGATRTEQLEETMRDVKDGPLGMDAVERIDGIWKKVAHDAPVDNFSSYMGIQSKA
jgi:aflatoxin B1 aldehyde reductase